MLWTPAAFATRVRIDRPQVVAIVTLRCWSPILTNRIRKSLAATRRVGCCVRLFTPRVVRLWIGLTAWCLSGFKLASQLERREA